MASKINLNLNDNGFRASKLLIDGGGYLTKQIILQKAIKGKITNMDEFLAEKNVKKKITLLKTNKLIKGSQSDILYPSNGDPTKLGEWDITLSTLILNSCFILNSAEKNAVEDIRRIRNKLYGHTAKVEMTDAEFQINWTDISSTLSTHSTLLTDPNSIAFIKDMTIKISKETLSADTAIHTLKEWYEWGVEVEHKIEEMIDDQRTLFSEAETKCEDRHRDTSDQLDNIRTRQERTADDVSTILKLIKRGKRPVTGTKLNRKLYQRVNTLKCLGRMSDNLSSLMDLTKGATEQTVDRTELNRKIKQAKLKLKVHQHNLEEFNIPCKTRMTETVTQQLQKNKIVTLKGIPGSGKTHLANNVIYNFLSLPENKNIEPLIISKASEIERVLDPDGSFVLLVDDMIGKSSFDASEYKDWVQYIETLMSHVKVGQLYVVFTIRTAIFKQCQRKEMSSVFAIENVIETDGYLLENEKRDILELYRKYHGVNISSDQSDKIIEQQYVGIGFPLLCRMMTGHGVDEMFSRQTEYIKADISPHASNNPLVFVTLFLTLVGDNIFSKNELTQDQKACFKTLQDFFKTNSMDMNMLYQTAHMIEKTYITFNKIENNFSFIHETVAHSAFEVALDIHPDTLIEKCPFDLLIRNLNLITETANIELQQTNPYLLNKDRIINRMKKVLSLEDCTHIRYVTSATIWKDKSFVNDALCMFDIKYLCREDEYGMSMPSYFASCGRKLALEKIVTRLEKEHIKPNNQLQNALEKACKAAEQECVDYLLSKNIKVSGQVVIEAVKGGSMTIVKHITDLFGFDNIKTLKEKESEKTLLHIAAEKGRLDIVKYIYQICPFLLNICDINGCNATHFSAKTNGLYTIECLKFLIKVGINPSEKNSIGESILHQAAVAGDKATIKYLCELYPDMIHVTNNYGRNALHNAAQKGSVECMKFLDDKGIDASDKANNGDTILHLSALGGNLVTIKYICETYPDMIPVTDNNGRNALHNATQSGGVECMKFLVGKCIDATDKTDDEETILHLSALGGNIVTINYICETYPDMIPVTDNNGRNALHYAAHSGGVECMKFLVGKCIDATDKTDDEETILHLSALGGNIVTMKYICETYPDMILVTDNDGINALHNAAHRGSVECMKYLVYKGIDAGDKTDGEETILHSSALGGNIVTMEYICETYPDMIHVTDNDGRNALHNAACNGSVECMKFLIDKGIDAGDKTDGEETILHRSALGGNIVTMEYICETYPDMIHVTDNDGRNALHNAACNGSVECMKFLIDKGIDAGDKTDGEETILHRSALGGNIVTMKYICETYPDMIHVTDNDGRNALHNAAHSGSVECMKCLVDKGIDAGDKTDGEETILHRSAIGGNIVNMQYICETYPDMIHVTANNGRNALHKAAYSGSVECMKFLVDKGIDAGDKTDGEETILHLSALGGNIVTMEYICETYPDMILVTDKYGRNALHNAAHRGSVECMKFLVDKGIEAGDKTDGKETILHRSAMGGNIVTMKYICETYPDMIHVTDNDGINALHKAAYRGSVECMKYLVYKGIDAGDKTDGEETILHRSAMGGNIVNIQYICETYPYMIHVTANNGRNALHNAAHSGSVECMKYIVDKGIDAGDKTDGEETILHRSAMGGNIVNMRYICETYPDMIHVADNGGRNALHNAAHSGSVECMKYLVDKGIYAGDKTDGEETILHRSALGGKIVTMEYICETYPDMIHVTDNDGRNALHNAAFNGSVECMKCLVHKGIDAGDKTDGEETILHLSALGGNIVTMEYICETYPDMIHVTDNDGRNALHNAAFNGSVECMKCLVHKGIDAGDKTDGEETILHLSALGGNIVTMKYICETYPDMIHVTDKYGRNALHNAAHSGSVECMKYLVDKGIDSGDKTDVEETILHLSALGGNIVTMKYICETYPDMIPLTDNGGRNALHNAAYSGSVECMKFLVDKGIDTGDKTDVEETILHLSALCGNIVTMKYICETYPDMIPLTDNGGRNALHNAAYSGSVECMKFLVDKGIDTGDKTDVEETILHLSALCGNIVTMKYICETYPDMIHVVDIYGRNALHYVSAQGTGDIECLQFLLDQGIHPLATTAMEENICHLSIMSGNAELAHYIIAKYDDLLKTINIDVIQALLDIAIESYNTEMTDLYRYVITKKKTETS